MANSAAGSQRTRTMSATSTRTASGRRPMGLLAVISVMTGLAGPRLAVAMVSMFCVAGMAGAASAPITPDDLNGRWVSAERGLTLDVARCGEGWCGVEVKADASCGRTQLRVGGAEDTVYPA